MRRLVPWLLSIPLFAAPLAADQAMSPEVNLADEIGFEIAPTIAYDSTRDAWLVAWSWIDPTTGLDHAKARRLDRYGRPDSPIVTVASAVDGRARVVRSVAYDAVGDSYLFAYELDFSGDGSDWDVYVRSLSGDLVTLGTEEPLAALASNEKHPRIAFSPGSQTFLVAWVEFRVGVPSAVRGALIASDGTVTWLTLAADATEPRDLARVASLSGGDRFFVAYGNGEDVLGRVVLSGAGYGPEVTIAAWPDFEQTNGIASCSGDRFLVTWESYSSFLEPHAVYARYVAASDGNIIGPPLQITQPASDTSLLPVIACIGRGEEYLVAFQRGQVAGSGPLDARRVRADGSFDPVFRLGEGIFVEAAGGAAGSLVAYATDVGLPGEWQVHARVVWSIFSDGFEWGSSSLWSLTVP